MNILLLSFLLTVAPSPTQTTFGITYKPAAGESAGLPTSLYVTNLTFFLLSTTDVTQPTNTWPVLTNWPAITMTNQGPLGTRWTNSIVTDGSSRFFAVTVSNTTSGTVSPFSNLAPFYQSPQPGIIDLHVP